MGISIITVTCSHCAGPVINVKQQWNEFTKLVDDERGELENGAPVDISARHWIDVRVNMPNNSIYNQMQAETKRLSERGGGVKSFLSHRSFYLFYPA